jgi:hypothetical protein
MVRARSLSMTISVILSVIAVYAAVSTLGERLAATQASFRSIDDLPASTGSVFTPLGPTRILDTRNSGGGGHLGPGSTRHIVIIGLTGVASDANAVLLNVTAVAPTAGSFLKVYPDGISSPATSNLDFSAGQTTANMALVPIGADGSIDIYNNAGNVDILVDIAGFYAQGATGTFTSVAPQRILDTRTGFINGTSGTPAPLGADHSMSLQVGGAGTPVPSQGLTAVVLNLTVVNAIADSFLTVFPSGQNKPDTSNLDFSAGQTIANLVVVPVSNNDLITIWNHAGTVDVVADLFGYYTGGAGSTFTPVTPVRALDTRHGTGVNGTVVAPLGSNAVLPLTVTGVTTGVPATATAVVLHITAVNATGASDLTVYPDGMSPPGTTNLHVISGQIISNLAIVAIGANGVVDLWNHFNSTDVVGDISGYYS